ncbi:MFS transporter [Kitasatospora sp. NPDC090091]|uniref:MFS transporter n=1 Tax=Kitasatospora sp. NPDC090091 TaxID=3364081 RepID=UPI00381A2C90
MLSSYRRLFALPGTAAFTLAGLLGRLAMSMTGVSLVVLLAERRGSYALAGTVSAVGLATGAIGLPLIGRLVDRHGQARVTVPAALYNALPITGLLLCLRAGAPDWTLYACWAAAAAAPNLGGMARARWAHLYRADPELRHLANSFEQALDELCFTTGPVLAMLLCTTVAPEAGLVTAATLGTAGALLFASRRRTEPPVAAPARAAARPGSPLRVPGLRVLLLTFLATGLVFGAMEVTTVAYTDALGRKPLAGLLLGLVAAGSCAAGLAFGLRRPRRAPGTRFLLGMATMAVVLLLPLAAATGGTGLGDPGLVLLGVALFAAGTGTAPTMVTGMTLVQDLLPQGQLNEGMAVTVSGIVVGISGGAALGGAVAEHATPGTGYLLPAGAAALALLIALAGRRHLRPPAAAPRPAPVEPECVSDCEPLVSATH